MTASTVLRLPTSADVEKARRLAEGGFGPSEISRVLARDGVQASRFAVARWLDPEKARRHREQTRQWHRARRASLVKPRLAGLKSEALMARLRLYHEQGLSNRAIATFMSLEHGAPLSEHNVRYALESGRPPRVWRETA